MNELEPGDVVSVPLSFRGHKVSITSKKGDFILRALEGTKTFYEADLLGALLDGKPPSGCYVDVGAHIGNHTLAFATVFPATHIIAIEPAVDSFELLTRNTERFEHVERHNVAIHDTLRRVHIEMHPTINTGSRRVHTEPAAARASVRARRIDDILHGRDAALIKIDVEDSEMAVLRSAKRTISRCRPIIIVEAKTSESLGQVRGLLGQYDYVASQRYCASATYIFRSKSCA
jgi:FkbM family methyltransferase